jgi:hypothetical protein
MNVPTNFLTIIRELAQMLPPSMRADFEVTAHKLVNHRVEAIKAEAFLQICLLYIAVGPAVCAARDAKEAVRESSNVVASVAALAGESMVQRMERFTNKVLPAVKTNIAHLSATAATLRRKSLTNWIVLALALTAPVAAVGAALIGLRCGYDVGIRRGAAAIANDPATARAVAELKLRGMGLNWNNDGRLNDRTGRWRCLFITGGKFDSTFTTEDGAAVIVIESAQVMPPLLPPAASRPTQTK